MTESVSILPASGAATTGSRGEKPRQAHKGVTRFKDLPPLIKETDLTARHRLIVEYMVHGVHHKSLAERCLREFPIIDPETGMKIGAEMKPVPLGEPLNLYEAAALVRLRRRPAQNLSRQPAFQRLLQRETMAFRETAKTRAWRKIDELAHKPGDGSAAWAKVNHQAATTITGEPRQGGTTVNVQTNVGVSVKAGLVLRLPADAPQIPLEAEDSSE